MNVYINNAKENWVVDRFVDEWNIYNNKQSSNYRFGEKIIWLIAPWTWKKIPKKYLLRNKVICTIHHIDEDKFDKNEEENFFERDKIVDHYHVISKKTEEQISRLTSKPITTIPFWVNQNIWYEITDKEIIREKYGFDKDTYLVGSFQRDTEGKDLISPKLSKGPDRFIEIVKNLKKDFDNFKVVLTGTRRHYIINKLKEEGIEYSYFEMNSFKNINELYNILNLYIVSSRYEGGPQSILECSLTKTPIISTDVGIASQILSSESIFNMSNYLSAKPNQEEAYLNVQKYMIPEGFKDFNNLIREVNEN